MINSKVEISIKKFKEVVHETILKCIENWTNCKSWWKKSNIKIKSQSVALLMYSQWSNNTRMKIIDFKMKWWNDFCRKLGKLKIKLRLSKEKIKKFCKSKKIIERNCIILKLSPKTECNQIYIRNKDLIYRHQNIIQIIFKMTIMSEIIINRKAIIEIINQKIFDSN